MRKQLIFFIPILVILLFLSGCDSSSDSSTQRDSRYELSMVDSVGNAPIMNSTGVENVEIYGGFIANKNDNNTYYSQENIYAEEALNFQYFIKSTSTEQKKLDFFIEIRLSGSGKPPQYIKGDHGQISITEERFAFQQITLNGLSDIIKIDFTLYLEANKDVYVVLNELLDSETGKQLASVSKQQQVLLAKINTKDQSTLPNANVQSAGFLPNPDGFGFANIAQVFPDDITSQDIARLIGTNKACYNGDPENCVLTAIGTFKREDYLSSQKRGQCYGMAVAAMMLHQGLFFDGKSYASDYNSGVSETFELKKHNVAKLIAVKFLNQNTPQVQKILRVDTDTLSEYQKVLDGFSGNDPIAVLSIFTATGDEGHAVTPYAITQEEDNKARIYVYDNNYPGRDDLYFEINLNNGHWSYAEGAINAQAQGGSDYYGEGSVNPFYAIPLSATLHEQLEEDITLNSTVKYSLQGSKGIRMLISQDDEHAIGYDFETGQYVNNIEGAEERKNFENMPSDYILPLNPNLTDASTIESAAELDRLFNEIQTVEIGTLPDIDDAKITLSMQAFSPNFDSALSFSTFLDKGQKYNVAFHPKGRMLLLEGDITEFIAVIAESDLEESQKEKLYPSLNIHFDDRELMRGYIHNITLKNIPNGVIVAAFIDKDGAVSIFAFNEESDEVVNLSEKINYTIKSTIVDQQGRQEKSKQTLSQPVNSGMRLRPVYNPSGTQAKSKGQDVIIERIF